MNASALLATITLSLAATASHAFPIATPGTEGSSVVVASTGHVFATYQGNSAAYSNDLLLNNNLIFNNHTTPVGTTVDLGEFSAGIELIFELFVRNTGNSFFTGPSSRNADTYAHARVQSDWLPSETLVSFEDLFNGPFEFNDLSFSFTNTVGAAEPPSSSIPESSTALLLMVSGISFLIARKSFYRSNSQSPKI
jgi:hypothetical protein